MDSSRDIVQETLQAMAQRAGNLGSKKIPDEMKAELEQGFKAAVMKQSSKKRTSAMDVIPVAELDIPKHQIKCAGIQPIC